MREWVMLGAILSFTFADASAGSGPLEVRAMDESAPRVQAKIEDVSFLTGRWIGEGLGACAEELIAPIAGGQIMGMFRLMKPEGGLRFYEFYTIAEKDGSLVLRIKHFNPDLTGWEEKADTVDFPLVAIDGTTAYFDGLTFSRQGRKGFVSAVMIEGQGVESFEMRNAKAGEACR